MEKLKFPLSWKNAFNDAIDAFARNGFQYALGKRDENEATNSMTVEIDATQQETFDLGVKVGYRLPVKINDSERANAIQCLQIVIDRISKDDPATTEELQKAIRKLQQI